MGVAARSNLVWTAMIAAGVALGAIAWLAWPEAETRLVRLPYGEALPKHPPAAASAPGRLVEAPPPAAPAPPAPAEPAPEPVEEVRVIAAAEPEPEPVPAPAPVPAVDAGRPPVASETEDDGYVETPEELGAEPLPGEGDPVPEQVGEAGEDDDDPVLGVIELPQPGAE